MKAPKCYRCDGRHWSTQPCPASNGASNKEKVHLTASNEEAEDDGRSSPVVLGEGDSVSGVRGVTAPTTSVVQASPDTPLRGSPTPSTKQRWSRKAYNAYMRDYMARRRAG